MPKSWTLFAALTSLTLVACFDSGKSDDDDDDDGGGAGWDLGDDTGTGDGGAGDGGGGDGGGGDGGGGDGGGGDGGGGDGCSTDGGSGDGGGGDGGGGDGGGGDGGGGDDGGLDSGILVAGYAGEAEVSPGESYDGYENSYYIGFGSELNCVVTSTLRSASVLDSCDDCRWAFEVDSSDSYFSDSVGCDLVGLSDASGYDGYTYNYGYQDDYYISGYGDYGVLQYYFSGYGWYAVAIAEYERGTFTYDWPSGYYYYYK